MSSVQLLLTTSTRQATWGGTRCRTIAASVLSSRRALLNVQITTSSEIAWLNGQVPYLPSLACRGAARGPDNPKTSVEYGEG